MNRNLILGAIAVTIAAAAGHLVGSGRLTATPHRAPTDAAAPAKNAPAGRKVLYYRNPMGLPDTSPTPKKDSMGMDYLPVYESDEPAGGGVRIGTEKMQRLGVRTARVERRALDARVRATGRVEIDERRVFAVTPKFEGYVERLYVNATGQFVTRGERLFDTYSPELLAAQREYAIAAQGLVQLSGADPATVAGMKRLADATLARLRNWDVTEEEIAALAAGGEPRRRLGFLAPASGYVLERKALQGMRFMPGEMLYQIADLSHVWVIADVFEQDIGRVRVGHAARLTIDAYPGREFEGRVTYVYPTLKADTRSAQVRVELVNPGGLLKPAMYAHVALHTGVEAAGGAALVVPNSAVIDSGKRQIVLVDLGDGRFEPRDVRLGGRGEEFTNVLDGVREGESVVVAANFLIDAESNLKAALGAMAPAPGAAAPPAAAQAVHTATGILDAVDAGTMTISHEPIASLRWPKMTMDFAAANDAVARAVPPGRRIDFDIVERAPGEWVVTRVAPAAAGAR